MSPPKKRKKTTGEQGGALLMDCDSDEDGLPTQVKVKSSFGPKSNLTVRIGTPPGNGERDKNKQTPQTTLPLPFSSNQNQSSSMSVGYQQSQGQDEFITTFSDSVSHGPSYREMLQSHQTQNIYSQIDSVPDQSHHNISLHDNTNLLHATNTGCHDGQSMEGKLLAQLSKSDAIIAEQKELMQAVMSHREVLLSNRGKSNFDQVDVQSSQSAAHMSHMQRVSQAPVSHSDQVPMYGCQRGQISQVSSQSDVPSHIAHHYPKISTTEQNRPGSQQIFNPAFTEQSKNISRSSYNQSQY